MCQQVKKCELTREKLVLRFVKDHELPLIAFQLLYYLQNVMAVDAGH